MDAEFIFPFLDETQAKVGPRAMGTYVLEKLQCTKGKREYSSPQQFTAIKP